MDAATTRFEDGTATIGVVGLGYVGLPLAIAYAQMGYAVIGFDISDPVVDGINSGVSHLMEVPTDTVSALVSDGTLRATTDLAAAMDADALILCVPTPLNEFWQPDLSYVTSTVEALLPHLRAGQVMSLESTSYPGTTEEEILTRIESAGFRVGEDYFLVYSPERIDPGNITYSTTTIPKVVGGTTPECLSVGIALYGGLKAPVVPVSSTRVAEFAKLLENIYRSVNIGLVNELKVVADAMDIDIWEVIDAAATKPFGFEPFYPGPGLGGHCIPVDPFYLTWKAREYGVHTRFIELAGEINRLMPSHIVRKTIEALNSRKKSASGSRILIMGLAYKANVADTRESPSLEIMDQLADLGAEIDYYDPHVPEIAATRQHDRWTGKRSVRWSEDEVGSYDCVVIATDHDDFDLRSLLGAADLIVDTRNAIMRSGLVPAADQLVRA